MVIKDFLSEDTRHAGGQIGKLLRSRKVVRRRNQNSRISEVNSKSPQVTELGFRAFCEYAMSHYRWNRKSRRTEKYYRRYQNCTSARITTTIIIIVVII